MVCTTQQIKRMVTLSNGILAIGLTSGRVQIWNPKDSGDKICEFRAHQTILVTIAALSNGYFATGAHDGSVHVWKFDLDAKFNKLTRRNDLSGHLGSVNTLALLPNGHLVSGSADGVIKIWSLPKGELVKDLVDACQKHVICSAVISETCLAAAGEGPFVNIWNIETGKVQHRINTRTEGLADLIQLPNKTDLLTDSLCKTIKIWNIETGLLLRTFSPDNHFFRAATMLPTGDIAFGLKDGTIKVWNPVDGSTRRTLIGHQHPVSSTSLLKDGTLASISTHSDIKLWSL